MVSQSRSYRTKRIKIALTEAEYAHLVEEAQATGIRLAVLCREKAIKGKVVTPAPKINLEAYRVLRGAANNLNQIARYLNTTKQNPDQALRAAIGKTLLQVDIVSREVIASGDCEN
ncbi:plasmid mobilization relaxosome protein MobC [Thermoleptolyngbya oregonensis NK1-22]|uniref:Plasmid mobilization relaxosome protein MobC n=1 Tax=Thermoleptolyngbya oregonensis NK1-22 TaxID=2547457 RepID=A0AA96Y838_9CYAN|nr:plasmid mobilization relaxosome protein MobC [Thermoleptolyngbya oregonensis NK1-22]